MIKKTIKYKDYDGADVEKDFWFNLDAGEIAEIELSSKQGYSELLRIAQENEDPTIVGDAFRKIVLGAVGRREGAYFIKDQEAIYALQYSGAYSELIIWMLTNPVEAGLFINGMLPAAAQEQLGKDDIIEKMRAKTEQMAQVPDLPAAVEPPAEVVTVNLNPELPNFEAMTSEEFEAWKATQN